MTARFWVVATTNALLVLFLGVCWYFFLLLALNGVSSARAQPVLTGGIVIAILAIIMGFAAGGWGAQAFTTATRWSFWLVAPALIVVTLVVTSLFFFVSTIVLLIVNNIG